MSNGSEPEQPDEATVSAYLANRLDTVRAEAFEEYCLRHPDFARQVELDLLFRSGIRQVRSPDTANRRRRRWSVSLAIAASVALFASCGLWFLLHAQPGAFVGYRSVNDLPASLLAGPRASITLIRARGASTVHRAAVPSGAGILTLRLAPDVSPGAQGYVLTVTRESRVLPPSAALDHLQPTADGYVEAYFPLTSLVGQTFKITLAPSPSTGKEPLSFRLQVTSALDTTTNAP